VISRSMMGGTKMNIIYSIGELLPGGATIPAGGLDPKGGFVLFPKEEALVVKAGTKRRREFLAGRSYARHLLYFADVDVTIGPDQLEFEARLVNIARPSCSGQRHLSGTFGYTEARVFAVTFFHPCQAQGEIDFAWNR
jgi:hypothetical protein